MLLYESLLAGSVVRPTIIYLLVAVTLNDKWQSPVIPVTPRPDPFQLFSVPSALFVTDHTTLVKDPVEVLTDIPGPNASIECSP